MTRQQPPYQYSHSRLHGCGKARAQSRLASITAKAANPVRHGLDRGRSLKGAVGPELHCHRALSICRSTSATKLGCQGPATSPALSANFVPASLLGPPLRVAAKAPDALFYCVSGSRGHLAGAEPAHAPPMTRPGAHETCSCLPSGPASQGFGSGAGKRFSVLGAFDAPLLLLPLESAPRSPASRATPLPGPWNAPGTCIPLGRRSPAVCPPANRAPQPGLMGQRGFCPAVAR